MKKFSVLIALALLAVAGTGYAATCAQDNVPAATLLVPFWKVSRNGSTGTTIGPAGTDTFVAITNVSSTGIIVHATLWNRYSKAILDWNIPMTGFDVVAFTLKNVLNGQLTPNTFPFGTVNDPCTASAAIPVGFGATRYVRFTNPDAFDRARSISFYRNPAYSGTFQRNVWDSLDENPAGDYRSTTSAGAYVDRDNPGCGVASDGVFEGDFSGYLTLDVVNFCTNYFPDEAQFYQIDAIATVGWDIYGYTPNTIMGDVFFIDPASDGSGNISGDQMVSLEFDRGINWVSASTADRSFYGRFVALPGGTDGPGVVAAYSFVGDGREPLGERFGFRYVNGGGLRTWAKVFRLDNYRPVGGSALRTEFNLCNWAYGSSPGFQDNEHLVILTTYNLDEQTRQQSGGPSGDTPSALGTIFLETQRIDLLNNADFIPDASFTAGWIRLALPGFNNPTLVPYSNQNQAWIGIEHSAPGAVLSVGHSATLLNNNFLCFEFNAVAPSAGVPATPTGNSDPQR